MKSEKYPELQQRIVTLNWIKENALFYIVDKINKESIAICWDFGDVKRSGYSFRRDNQAYKFDPISIGGSVIDLLLKEKERYDITADFQTALNNIINTK